MLHPENKQGSNRRYPTSSVRLRHLDNDVTGKELENVVDDVVNCAVCPFTRTIKLNLLLK